MPAPPESRWRLAGNAINRAGFDPKMLAADFFQNGLMLKLWQASLLIFPAGGRRSHPYRGLFRVRHGHGADLPRLNRSFAGLRNYAESGTCSHRLPAGPRFGPPGSR